MLASLLDLLTVALLLFGLFFMGVGAIGLLRLPDFFNRVHAIGKCTTLGLIGMLLAAAIHLARLPDADVVQVFSKVVLLIVFIVVSAPVGAHMLSKAAHLDGAPMCKRTLDDELRPDQGREHKT